MEDQPARPAIRPLYRIFTEIPGRYDLINHVITMGLDKGWRRQAALACLESSPARILDICCGTGDLTVNIARLAKYEPKITAVDYSQPMLDEAERKAAREVPGRRIKFVNSEIAQLPFPGGYFDCIGISFAFRNLTYKNPLAKHHIDEVLRVLRTGGKYVIVESSQPKWGLIRALDHLYLRLYVYPAGYLISRNRPAYRYLTDSASNFFQAEEAAGYLLKSGFSRVTFRRLFFGAAAIHVAVK